MRIISHPTLAWVFPHVFSSFANLAVKRLENHLPQHRDGSNDPLRRDQHLGLLIP
ncbi:MAG: hypothetical protein NT142_10865 [Planctomycetota bacterium]|nr:hypothetical protein [Planctomycetota bacterium]